MQNWQRRQQMNIYVVVANLILIFRRSNIKFFKICILGLWHMDLDAQRIFLSTQLPLDVLNFSQPEKVALLQDMEHWRYMQ